MLHVWMMIAFPKGFSTTSLRKEIYGWPMHTFQGLSEGKSEELYNRRRQLGVSSDSWESAATDGSQQRQLGVSSDSWESAATAGSQQRQLGISSDSWESAATAGNQQRQLRVSSDSWESAA
jgi:hypothetical protein